MRPLWLLLAALPTVAAAQTTAAQTTGDSELAAAEGRFVRALTEHYLGNDTMAVRLLDGALALRPGDPAVLDALAEVYTDLGQTTDALYHAGLAVQAAPDNAATHLRLGALQGRSGRRAEAIAEFETAHRLSPTDAEPLVALADLYRNAGQAADEQRTLEALVALGETPAAYLRLADLYADAGETEQATDALRAASRLAPSEPAIRDRLAAALGEPAGSSVSTAITGSAPGALGADEALAIVAADPRRLDAWAAALDALARSSDPRAAETADEATLLFPTVPSVLAPAAEAYLSAGRTADAARAARSGLAALDAAAAPEDDPARTASLRERLDRALASASR